MNKSFTTERRPIFPGTDLGLSTVERSWGRHYPVWTLSRGVYHVCFRLADSVPVEQQRAWVRERRLILERADFQSRTLTDYEINRLEELYSEHVERYLASGHGSCALRTPEIADIIRRTLEFGLKQEYSLHAWCIMPNHVHVVVEPFPFKNLKAILKTWKSVSAHRSNKVLGKTDVFWQKDSYNRLIRDETEYHRQVRYVWDNPDKAGLRSWPWRFRIGSEP